MSMCYHQVGAGLSLGWGGWQQTELVHVFLQKAVLFVSNKAVILLPRKNEDNHDLRLFPSHEMIECYLFLTEKVNKSSNNH